MTEAAGNKDNPKNNPATQAYLDFGVTAFMRHGVGWVPQRADRTAIPCERGFVRSADAILYGARVVRKEQEAAAQAAAK